MMINDFKKHILKSTLMPKMVSIGLFDISSQTEQMRYKKLIKIENQIFIGTNQFLHPRRYVCHR